MNDKHKMVYDMQKIDVVEFAFTSLGKLAIFVSDLQQKYGNEAMFNLSYDDYNYWDCSVEYQRPETDFELDTRLNREVQANVAVQKRKEANRVKKEQEAATEKQLYLELKKKYEPSENDNVKT